jgi:hypothetical protein
MSLSVSLFFYVRCTGFFGEPRDCYGILYLVSSGYMSSLSGMPSSSRSGFNSSRYCWYWPLFSTLALMPVGCGVENYQSAGSRRKDLTALCARISQKGRVSSGSYPRRSGRQWGNR